MGQCQYQDGHMSPATPPGLYICTLVTRVGRYIMMGRGTCQEPLLQAFFICTTVSRVGRFRYQDGHICHQPLLQAFTYMYSSLEWVDFCFKIGSCHQPLLQAFIYSDYRYTRVRRHIAHPLLQTFSRSDDNLKGFRYRILR